MSAGIYGGLQAGANRAAAAAVRTGTVKIDGHTYTLTFNGTHAYDVTDESGERVMRLVTKRITEAKRDLRYYLT